MCTLYFEKMNGDHSSNSMTEDTLYSEYNKVKISLVEYLLLTFSIFFMLSGESFEESLYYSKVPRKGSGLKVTLYSQ